MKDLINPLYECTSGTCPVCGQPLIIVDSEMLYMELDDEGYPIDSAVTYTRTEGICYGCGNKYKYKKSGFKYSPVNKYIENELLLHATIKERNEKIIINHEYI